MIVVPDDVLAGCNVTVPWSCVTSSRQIASPSPLPSIPASSSRGRRTNGSKTRSCASAGIPGPESAKVTCQESAADRPSMRTWPPIGVYFKALDARFPKICWHRNASVTTDDSAAAAWHSHLIPRDAATDAKWRSISVTSTNRITAQAQRTRAARDRRVVQ